MGHWKLKTILFSIIFTACFCYSNACLIDGTVIQEIYQGWVKDVDSITIWQNQTTGVEGINSSHVGGVTDNRQYLGTDIVDSRFQLYTTALFEEYEEHEVSHNMTVSVIYRCTGGTNSVMPQVILVHVIDTNNNPPRFMLPPSSEEFVFTIAAPMPPGYEITSCIDLIVRDIDLTTQKIVFEIQDNQYFEIQKEVYRNPSTPKEFKAIIRTKTFIRSFPEELKLTIWATDNDLTGERNRTTETTVRFLGNTDFVLPEELVFSETFYLADYTDDNRVVLTEPITLQNGYDKLVQFYIRGVYKENFELVEDQENKRSIRVIKVLEGDDLEETNIHIIVTADRELTSGASTTVVLRLPVTPKVVPLEFERPHYKGTIEDDILLVTQLILSQGYEDAPVNATVRNGHLSHFSVNVQGNTVTLSMTSLDESIIMENSFLNLEIFATNGRSSATTIVTLEIIKDDNITPIFNKPIYTGSYGPAGLILDPIILVQGHDGIAAVDLYGEDKKYFSPRLNGTTVTIEIVESIPPEIYSRERIVVSLEVTKPRTVGARAAIIINFPTDSQTGDDVSFGRVLYRGVVDQDQIRHEAIAITGYDGTTVEIIGQYSSSFEGSVSGGEVTVQVTGSLTLPADITHVALELHAGRARTVLLLNVLEPDSQTGDDVSFGRVLYRGVVDQDQIRHEAIAITGYDGTTVEIIGQYSSSFEGSVSGGEVTVQVTGSLTLPADITHVALELHAGRARTVLLLNVLEPDSQTGDDVSFGRVLYRGVVDQDQIRHEAIAITGYDGTTVEIIGQYSSSFEGSVSGGEVTVQVTGSLTLPADITHVALELHAGRARTVLLLNVLEPDSQTGDDVSFGRVLYRGVVDQDQIRHEAIAITGYDGTTVEIIGQYSSSFEGSVSGGEVTVQVTGSLTLPADITHVALELHAGRARTVLLLNVLEPDSQTGDDVSFGRVLYRGVVDQDQIRHEAIAITGYDGTTVEIIGQYSSSFEGSVSGGEVTVQVTGSLTLPADITYVALELHAGRARTVLLLNVLEPDSQTGDDVSFGRVLYRGVVDQDQIRHEAIAITGYDGTTVEIIGQYSSSFEGSVSGGGVTVQVTGSPTLPADITHVALELHAGRARTVLLLNVLEPGVPLEPSVTFSSESYLLSADMVQTGLVGRVSATADNGEKVTFSLGTDDAHLQTRLSINNEGELYLFAPAYSGVYTFQVIATTVITQVTGTASVHLTVQSVTVCEDKGFVMPPLVILERDEESAHSNLVVLDSTQHAGCHFTLTNRWPADQKWLYVNEFGLHTNSIDREHASIAFMALSQVQVELILHCRSDTDNAIREKRSETTARLGPYDYGSNKWILTDTIPYNSRRSLVNLIVNDINDNDPIFVGKEHEPIVVGYPTNELEERILPRSLAELKATDADIGVNAALRYWSSESVLAVAPTTGFVHVRSGARLTHDQTLNVTATDENGQGRSGYIQLMVKLLDLDHIAVVTIRDVFLDDETTVLAQLSDAVGYEVKALRSVVISDDIDGDVTRKKRETGTPRASLQLFVYGINEREPVTVDRLTTDISANAAIASVVSTIPLEDHLQDINILDPQIGLLVTTIILSVLLFAVIVIVAIWFFLRWRKNKNYDEFNDEKSLSSRNASLGELPKPEAEKPRLNIEDLKRSEQRLQEMLQAPIKKVTVEKIPKKREAPVEAVLDLPIIEPIAPVIIQAIDKLKDAEESSEDEFGEVSAMPRKSVVTFNENVENIIHIEDNADDDGEDEDASI